MTQQIINVGASANDGLGSNLRTAFTYCNDNFSQLYSRVQTTPPATLIGVPGDEAGMYAYDEFYFYYCFANFDAVNPIWNKALTISEPGNYGNANVALYLDGSAGNIVPANSGVQSLGNASNTFKDIFLSNSIITFNSLPIATAGSTLLVNGDNVVVASSVDDSITVTGNITGNCFIGNGSQLTNVDGNYSNANVGAYLPTYSGNLGANNISVTSNVNIGSNGNLFFNMVGANAHITNKTYGGGNITFYVDVSGTQIQQVKVLGNGGGLLSLSNVAGDYIIGNYFIGSGNTISNIQGGNVSGNVTSAVTAGTVTTNAQANITSVGTLTSVTSSGLVSTTGNITGGNILTAGFISATSNITAGNILTAGKISATGPVSVGVYTAANLNLITGTIGSIAAVSDSPTVGGRLAFWDTTNSRWSYVSSNTAV